MEGEHHWLGNLLNMVINDLLTGMILQVEPKPLVSVTSPPEVCDMFLFWSTSRNIYYYSSRLVGMVWKKKHHHDFFIFTNIFWSDNKPLIEFISFACMDKLSSRTSLEF